MPESPLTWQREEDGSWTAERGTGSALERTEGVYASLREVKAAAQRLLEAEQTKRPRRGER